MSRIRSAERKRADASIRGSGSLVRNQIKPGSLAKPTHQQLAAFAPRTLRGCSATPGFQRQDPPDR